LTKTAANPPVEATFTAISAAAAMHAGHICSSCPPRNALIANVG
jgi:hypothetical protein